MGLIDYDELQSLLSDTDLTAAEAHGMAVAMISVKPNLNVEAWLAELSDDAQSLPTQQEHLTGWFCLIQKQLNSDAFEFNPLLPDDEEVLVNRLMALKQWCQGFLYGLGRVYQQPIRTKDAQEILKDMTEFTRLDVNAEEGEEEEQAYAEISEYLRSAVLVLKDELSSNA